MPRNRSRGWDLLGVISAQNGPQRRRFLASWVFGILAFGHFGLGYLFFFFFFFFFVVFFIFVVVCFPIDLALDSELHVYV